MCQNLVLYCFDDEEEELETRPRTERTNDEAAKACASLLSSFTKKTACVGLSPPLLLSLYVCGWSSGRGSVCGKEEKALHTHTRKKRVVFFFPRSFLFFSFLRIRDEGEKKKLLVLFDTATSSFFMSSSSSSFGLEFVRP